MPLPQILRRKGTIVHELASGVAYGDLFPLDMAAEFGAVSVEGGNVAAIGDLTLNINALNNETVTIGLITKTFKTALSVPAVPDEVLIGPSASASIDGLIASFNGDPAGLADGLYSEGSEVSPDVICSAGAGDTMDVVARVPGTAANSVATTETIADVLSVWSTATLTTGTDFVATVDFQGTLDGLNFFPLNGNPIDVEMGGTGATSATAVGIWRVALLGLLGVRFPISAWTSGAPTVRFVARNPNS